MSTIAKLTADLELNSAQFRQEIDKASKSQKRFSDESKKANSNVVAFERSMKGAAQGVASFNGPLNGISGRISSVNSLLTSSSVGWASLGAAVAGTVAILALSVSEFEKVERQQLKTEALLKSTGLAAGRTAEQLDEQARRVALNTLASTDGIRQAQQVLLTFKAVQVDVFDRAIELSQDMAAVMGGDAKSAALQLGKALESPTNGLSALKRAGVSFTESEKDVIKGLEETGRTAEAQKLVLEKLAAQLGGAGAGEAGGLSGAADTAGQRWSEFLEAVNKTTGVSSIAKTGLDLLSAGLKNITDFINPAPIIRHNQLHHELVAIQEKRAALEESIFSNSNRNQNQINKLKEKELEIKKEIIQLTDAEIERQKKQTAALEAAEKAAAQQKADFEESKQKAASEIADKAAKKAATKAAEELEKDKLAQLAKLESIELEHLNEQEKLVYHYTRRSEIIQNALTNDVITEARKNELILSEAEKLNKSLADLKKKESEDVRKAAHLDMMQKVGYFSRTGNALLSMSQGQSKKLFSIGKGLALASAAVSIPAAVIEAIKNAGGLPWGAFAGIATFAEGMSQLAAIRSASFGSGGAGAAPSSGSALPAINTPSLESIAPGINADDTGRTQGTTIIFNGNVSTNDVPKLAEELKEHIKVSDFVLIEAGTRNGMEFRNV